MLITSNTNTQMNTHNILKYLDIFKNHTCNLIKLYTLSCPVNITLVKYILSEFIVLHSHATHDPKFLYASLIRRNFIGLYSHATHDPKISTMIHWYISLMRRNLLGLCFLFSFSCCFEFINTLRFLSHLSLAVSRCWFLQYSLTFSDLSASSISFS